MRRIRLATAAVTASAALVLTVAGCGSTGHSSLAHTKPPATSAPAVTPETSTPEDTAPAVEPLSGTWTFTDNVTVTLSRFTRGTTSEVAAPNPYVPYVGFRVTIDNGSHASIDLSETIVNANVAGNPSEQVFDENLDDPSTHLLPKHTLTYKVEFEAPRGAHDLQVEVTPGFDYDAAIFSGRVA
jgi:hypothetical protein